MSNGKTINTQSAGRIRGVNIMSKKRSKNHIDTLEASSTEIVGQPENAFEMVNKYGTYNIQPTSDSGNDFPHIAQGYPQNRGRGKKR